MDGERETERVRGSQGNPYSQDAFMMMIYPIRWKGCRWNTNYNPYMPWISFVLDNNIYQNTNDST